MNMETRIDYGNWVPRKSGELWKTGDKVKAIIQSMPWSTFRKDHILNFLRAVRCLLFSKSCFVCSGRGNWLTGWIHMIIIPVGPADWLWKTIKPIWNLRVRFLKNMGMVFFRWTTGGTIRKAENCGLRWGLQTTFKSRSLWPTSILTQSQRLLCISTELCGLAMWHSARGRSCSPW